MENIIFAVLVLGAIAIVFGLILSVAAKVFEVKVDERLPKIQECLAGANCGGCGAPLERIQAVAINRVDAQVGDIVTVEAENKQLMRMAAIVYTLPLVLFFAFFIAASLCGVSEGLSGVIGVGGILVGTAVAVRYNHKVKKNGGTPFTIIKKG